MDEIDYNTKILNFLAMTDTSDQEVAAKFLETSDWDETKAVNKFLQNKNISRNNESNNTLTTGENILENDNRNITNNIINSDRNRLNRILNEHNNNLQNNINNTLSVNNENSNNKKSSFIKFISESFTFILSCCSERREVKKSEEKRIFKGLPNIHDNFIAFCESIKKKVGIIVLYTGSNVIFLKSFISQLCQSTMIFDLLNKYFMFYPLLANTNEGYRTQNIVSDNDLLFPAFVFCSSKNETTSYNSILNKSYILTILESESITLKVFHSTLLDICIKLNYRQDNNSISEIDKSFGHLTDAEILNQQEFDMKELENEAIKKEEELKKGKLDEEKKKKEEEIKLKEIEEKAKEAKGKIIEEPGEDNPDSTIICFRFPDGEKSKNRRFLKTHTIQNLYDYITSLGKEIYTEKENNNFSLYQPFPPKKYDNMGSTLESEGLFPNAVIQIREEE